MFPVIFVRRFLVAAVVLATSFSLWSAGAVAVEFPKASLVIATGAGDVALNIEIARSAEQRGQGLMFRTAMAPDAGMLFIYQTTGTINMWMKNTILSLDMLFIAGDGRITRIVAHTTPMSEAVIGSRGAVRAILELNAGAARKLGIKTGDHVDLAAFLVP
jgi:uncharacterized membrane protein (UPF0127 family)